MDLFPHNREAYEHAVRLFKKEDRVCIIRPTGTGKSLIIAEFIKQHPSARHLFLAPGAHIFSEVEKHIKGANISFSTYMGVKTNRTLHAPHSFDFIYLDEFHRLGASIWGNNVNRLLQRNPRAKVLGTSATPIRYLDDNRNMATEIFNDRIATQLSLNSAIAEGILPAPTYVSALYSVKEECQELKQKIWSSDSSEKETVIKELDTRLIDWERSSGLDNVIKKHLTPNRRRVIVFCKHWKHLKYAQKILDPIFREIYGTVECLSLYSKKKETDNEACRKRFSGADSQAIILYAIDKVNEGLHARTSNTVILLRDTISPIVFYQQIGRAFSIGGAFKPLIIDLVNNFKNVNCLSFKSDLENELASSAPERSSAERERVRKRIKFIDETQDVRKIFQRFTERIDTWMAYYKRAKSFYEKHGHLYVPPDDIELCNWVRHWRNEYRKQKVAKERIPLLEAIGIKVPPNNTAQWLMRYYQLKRWLEEHGKLPVLSQNKELAQWLANCRQDFRIGKLTNEQIELLAPVFPLGGNRIRLILEARMERLIAHFKTGNIYTADESVRKELTRIKDKHRNGWLEENDLVYLRTHNVPVELTMNDFEWLGNVKKTIEWFKTHGDLPTFAENQAMCNFWHREEKYINKVHHYAKFISLDKDVEKSVNELQQIISEVRRSRRPNNTRIPK